MSNKKSSGLDSIVAELLEETPEKRTGGSGATVKPWDESEEQTFLSIMQTMLDNKRKVKDSIEAIAKKQIIKGRTKQQLWKKYREAKRNSQAS